jgi:disulfide bond formation protein DsbB
MLILQECMNIRQPSVLLKVALAVAVLATTGSLYFSLGLHLFPCHLCWYQRILMYPLVVILLVGLYENRRGVYRTVLPLSISGALIAGYHSWLQMYPGQTGCSFVCGVVQLRVFDLLTIPNLSFISFTLITFLMLGVRLSYRD